MLGQAPPPDQSRAALRPRNADEQAIARHFARFRERAEPIKPGQIVGWGPNEPPPPPPPPRADGFEELRAAVCRTDLIATGHATASRVIFNAGETIVVTIYHFRVNSWLRAPAGPPATLQVAVAGGEAVLDGQKTSALALPSYPLDQRVTMWLKQVPGSTTYAPVEVGMLTFNDDKPKMYYHRYIGLLERPDTEASIVTAIKRASATCPRTWDPGPGTTASAHLTPPWKYPSPSRQTHSTH